MYKHIQKWKCDPKKTTWSHLNQAAIIMLVNSTIFETEKVTVYQCWPSIPLL